MSTFDFHFEANLAAFELVNTQQVGENGPVDRIADPDLAWRWLQALHEHERLGRPSGRGIDRKLLLREMRKLRACAQAIADGLLADTGVEARDVQFVNRLLGQSLVRQRVVEQDDGFRFDTRPAESDIAALLHPITASLATLLTELDATRVGRCSSDSCVLYFYDVSRNRSRRWCSMERCGNRAKVSAHYHRSRAS